MIRPKGADKIIRRKKMKLVRKILVAMLLGTMAIQAVWADIFEKTKDELLIEAVGKGDLLDVKYQIVKNGADVNAKQNKYYGGNTALIVAVYKGYSEIIKYLISKGADVNAKNDGGDTALHIAIFKDKNKEIIELLIEKGADVNAKDNDGETALYKAVADKKYEIAKYLISKGADINAKTNGGTTILMKVAGTKEYYKTVTTVERQKNSSYKVGTDVVKTTTVAGSEVLEMVKYLVEKGADINAKSEYLTPLSGATYNNNIEIVKYLVSKGADVNLASGDGETPLMCASQFGYLAIVKYLISKGANVDIKDSKGETAIEYAQTDEIRKILQEQILKELE